MIQQNLVSVIIPTYNRSGTITRCIESVLAQTYQPIEIIIVDDGSTDDTSEILAGFIGRIKLVQQQNRGPSSARNLGFSLSCGTVVSFIDSDDTWHPQKIERQMRILSNCDERVSCCVCNATIIDTDQSHKESFLVSNVECDLSEGYWPNPCAIIASRFLLFNQVVAIRRSAFELLGGYDESLWVLEDHELALRLSKHGSWAFISDPLVTKYNDNKGIGVAVMQNKLKHANAWEKMLSGFLMQLDSSSREIRTMIESHLQNVKFEKLGLTLLQSKSIRTRASGRVLLFFVRMRKATQRRLFSQPQIQSVSLETGL